MRKCPSIWACNILVGHEIVFHVAPPLRPAKISELEMLARASSSCGYPSLLVLSFKPLLTVGIAEVHPFMCIACVLPWNGRPLMTGKAAMASAIAALSKS